MTRVARGTPRDAAEAPGERDPRALGHERLDVLVVLGCRVAADGTLCGAGARRVAAAAQAWHAGRAPRLIASGGRRWHGRAEADAMRTALGALGVDESMVVRELLSLSTFENAWYSGELMRGLGAVRAGVVTCDWHLPRALACFERLGVSAVGIAAPSPPARAWRRWRRAARERASAWLELGGRGARGRADG